MFVGMTMLNKISFESGQNIFVREHYNYNTAQYNYNISNNRVNKNYMIIFIYPVC